MQKPFLVIVLLCAIVGYNCTEIFVPRFTADAFKTELAAQNTHATDLKVAESKDGNELLSANGEDNDDITKWQSPSFWRVFENLFGSHWYKGKNVCSNVSTSTIELNVTQPPLARFVRARQCLEKGESYVCKTTITNGTHQTRTTEEFNCCPGYHLDAERKMCKAIVVKSLAEVLKENNATDFEQALAQRDLAGRMVFVFPNDGSPVVDETVDTHIANRLFNLAGLVPGEALSTPANTTILVAGWPTSSGDVRYSANCKKLQSTNNYISKDAIVHVAEGRIPTASRTILEILSSDPELSEAYKIAQVALNATLEAEKEHIESGIVHTLFVPTNKVLAQFFEEWPEAKENGAIMRSLAPRHVYENVIICASDEDADSEIKKVEKNGAETWEFKGATISTANVVARNGIIHILDGMIQLPLELQPLEFLLERLGMEEFSKAYQKLEQEWKQKGGTVSVFLPVGDHAENPYSDKEIRRHVLHGEPGSAPGESVILSDLNLYAHIQNVGLLSGPRLTVNCVPIIPFSATRFRNGAAVKVARRIPEGYADVKSALQSTGEHGMFLKLLEKYVENGGNYTGRTILAVDDAGLLKHAELLPAGVRAILGMEQAGTGEEVKDLKEFMGNLTVNGEICMSSIGQEELLPVSSGACYQVKRDQDGIWIGDAKVATSDLVASDGIVHGLAGLPKKQARSRMSIWSLINGFGQGLYDIIFV